MINNLASTNQATVRQACLKKIKFSKIKINLLICNKLDNKIFLKFLKFNKIIIKLIKIILISNKKKKRKSLIRINYYKWMQKIFKNKKFKEIQVIAEADQKEEK